MLGGKKGRRSTARRANILEVDKEKQQTTKTTIAQDTEKKANRAAKRLREHKSMLARLFFFFFSVPCNRDCKYKKNVRENNKKKSFAFGLFMFIDRLA
jgi:hypothetical protein